MYYLTTLILNNMWTGCVFVKFLWTLGRTLPYVQPPDKPSTRQRNAFVPHVLVWLLCHECRCVGLWWMVMHGPWIACWCVGYLSISTTSLAHAAPVACCRVSGLFPMWLAIWVQTLSPNPRWLHSWRVMQIRYSCEGGKWQVPVKVLESVGTAPNL